MTILTEREKELIRRERARKAESDLTSLAIGGVVGAATGSTLAGAAAGTLLGGSLLGGLLGGAIGDALEGDDDDFF